jgi:prepilin signal peptidase PulO-like enzyme (type II secretory pathway)
MDVIFLAILFIFWIMLGSFSSVIIYRIRSGEWWILWGRSHCGSCKKTLQPVDLVPIFSWLLNLWKCRMCKKSVSSVYPLLELSAWILFTCVWYFFIDASLLMSWDIEQILRLIFWLLISVISIIYIFYDILFLEISDRVLATGVWIAAVWVVVQSSAHINIFPSLSLGVWSETLAMSLSLWILFTTIAGLYSIIFKEFSEKIDILILFSLIALIYFFQMFFGSTFPSHFYPGISSSIGALWIFSFFFIQIIVSKWKWMGQWDLRIAILVWIILWSSLSFAGTMLTYFAWSIIWVWVITYQKIRHTQKWKKWTHATEIPFWPFIAIGFFLAVFFQTEILSFIHKNILLS